MKFREAEKYRVRSGQQGTNIGDEFGAFVFPDSSGRDLNIIASSGDPANGVYWEHVSVSLPNRCPNWREMCAVKDLFWDPEEVVMQLHPAKSQWINNHPYVLHLWRPILETIPLPPNDLVGDKNISQEQARMAARDWRGM